MTLGLPAPLFTIDFERQAGAVSRPMLKRLFDSLEPAFGLQVSLGQVNTVVLCPALTSHSEMSDDALRQAGIAPSTVRISVGDEDPRFLLEHLRHASALAGGRELPALAGGLLVPEAVVRPYREDFLDVHTRWVDWRMKFWSAKT